MSAKDLDNGWKELAHDGYLSYSEYQNMTEDEYYSFLKINLISGYSGSNKWTVVVMITIFFMSVITHQAIVMYLRPRFPYFAKIRDNKTNNKVYTAFNVIFDTSISCLPVNFGQSTQYMHEICLGLITVTIMCIILANFDGKGKIF